jgi:MFS family permease
VSALALPLRRAFGSLDAPNYRRYVAGQVVSLSGTWMQTVAELWLVLTMTGSSLAVGLVPALQFAPVLVGGMWGGLLADRVSRRRLLLVTQSLLILPALALWALTASGSVQLWMVYALVLVRGCITAVDNPARQSFFAELVGGERVTSAISLNGALINGARIVGPAMAALVIATAGLATCFLLNAFSFLAVVVALWRIRPEQLHRVAPVPRGPGQLRAALRHVRATPELRLPLALMAVVGTLAFNFQVLLPLLAHGPFAAGAGSYAALTAAMGVGAIAGALATAGVRRPGLGLVTAAALAFGLLICAAAVAPDLTVELIVLVPLGAASIAFAAGTNAVLQLAVEPAMRGRVMALYSVVFLGSTPIGAPLAGWIAQSAGPRSALALGGIATVVAALVTRALQPPATTSLRSPARNAPSAAARSTASQAVCQAASHQSG